MKRIQLLVLLVVLSSCNLTPHYGDYSDIQFDIPDLGIQTVQDAMLWTAHNIDYSSDDGEYWQTPGQTYRRGTGDCEDFVLLAMYLVYRGTGIEPVMVVGYNGVGWHAWVEVGGEWWEPQSGMRSDAYVDSYSNIGRIDYGEAMYRAVETHRNVIRA